ncbi:MAG: carboxymuconolactone decarboxylase family protein, partial [Phenylobacterium sp.]
MAQIDVTRRASAPSLPGKPWSSPMTTRLNLFSVSPKVLEPLLAIEEHIKASSLEPLLTHLVKIRASQINGCAYCL